MQIFILFIYFLIGYFIISSIRKTLIMTHSIYGKAIIITFLILYLIPCFLYFLDCFNIPSKFGYFKDMDTDRWFNFITSYVSAIIGTLLSGLILVLITLKQMLVQKEDNRETKRIDNAPLLVYNFSEEFIEPATQIWMLNSHLKEPDNYSLFLEIENIGLNHAKSFQCITSIKNKYKHSFSLDSYQPIIQKNQKVAFELIFWFKYNKDYKKNHLKISFNFTYYDVLNNKYSQRVELKCRLTDEFGSQYKGYRLALENIIVCNEKRV